MMKILHIVRALDVGGLERVVLDLVGQSASCGVDAQIVCLYNAGVWGGGHEGLAVLGGRSKFAKGYQLARLARAVGADILHSHNPEAHIVAVVAGLFSRIPVVHTKHGRGFVDHPRRVFLNILLNRLSQAVVAVSADAANVARDLEKCPPGKLTVIHNGIDTDKIQPLPAEAGRQHRIQHDIPPDAFVVGTVGRHSSDKDYPMLITAFCALSKQRPDQAMRLVLVGDGPEREALQREAERCGIAGSCLFAGEQRNVSDWLGSFDVFCLSSRTEGLSIALLEAGASGLPCVVTDVGGNREVVRDGATGFLVGSGDPAAMAGRLRQLMQDAGLRRRMGAAARERVAGQFSVAAMVAAYGEVWSLVLGS